MTDKPDDRELIALCLEHLSRVDIGIIDLSGTPAREMYATVAAWVRNRVDEAWWRESHPRPTHDVFDTWRKRWCPVGRGNETFARQVAGNCNKKLAPGSTRFEARPLRPEDP